MTRFSTKPLLSPKKKKTFKKKKTRASVPPLSTNHPSVLRRGARALSKASGKLSVEGWQVYQRVWSKSECARLRFLFEPIIKEAKETPKKFALQLDPKRLAMPVDSLPEEVTKKAMEKTKGLVQGDITQQNIVSIVALQGAIKQRPHVDTKNKKAFSVLHIISRRNLYIQGKSYKLNQGDVVVMKGNVCHAGAEHDYIQKSILLHVPVGFTNVHISACGN